MKLKNTMKAQKNIGDFFIKMFICYKAILVSGQRSLPPLTDRPQLVGASESEPAPAVHDPRGESTTQIHTAFTRVIRVACPKPATQTLFCYRGNRFSDI